MADHPTKITFLARRRPVCWVEHEGQWHPGHVRRWCERPEGWWAEVDCYTAPDTAFVLEVPGQRVWVDAEAQ